MSEKLKRKKVTLQELKNISPKNLLKLKEENLTSITDLVELSTLELKTLLGTTENKANLILNEARKSMPPFKAFTGHELMEINKSQEYLSLNCKSLDALLGGRGFRTGTVSEVYGSYAAGKTQLSLSLVISAILPKPFGLNGSVVFIDTEGTFEIQRLLSIAQSYKQFISQSEILDSIRVIKAKKALDQVQTLKRFLENGSSACQSYLNLKKPVKLLVVDSLTSHFRSEYLGRGTLSERQQKLNEHLRDISQFASESNCCSIVVNQVMANPDPFSTLDQELPIGGNVLSHATYSRIWLKKRKLYRTAVLVDSACLPAGEAMFKIAKRGVVDIDEEEQLKEEENSYVKEKFKNLLTIKEEEENKDKEENLVLDSPVQESITLDLKNS